MSKICVLNASNPGSTLALEADCYVDYRSGRQSCFDGSERIKQCSSWHSWAYALESEFFVYNKPGWEAAYKYDSVIILVNRDISLLIPLVKKLKLMKKNVAISFHEGVQDLISGSGANNENLANRWVSLYDLVQESDFYINIFGQMGPFFEGWFGASKVKFCDHGAPFDWNHGFTIPFEERKYDFLIGTRTFNQRLSRNTFITLATMNKFAKEGKSVHFISEDGDVKPLLDRLGMKDIIVHQGPFGWTDWLKMLANYKCLVHHDNSSNLGQICYDAAMVDVLTIGSTTWNAMLLGTEDNGNLNALESMIHMVNPLHSWVEASANKAMDAFKQEHHPEETKRHLEKLFS